VNHIFAAYGRYYDALYRDKDYLAEAQYIQHLLCRLGAPNGTILEFGSGTGQHGRFLAEQGYVVHGIERSPEMVARAASAPGFTCQQGDIAHTKTGRQYDAVISLFHVISYQAPNDQLNAVFANAAAHLPVGGLFVFDFWYAPAVYTQQPMVRVKRMSDEQADITRIAEPTLLPNENRVDVNYTVFVRDRETGMVETLSEVHAMRYFTLPELDLLGNTYGFTRVEAEEFLTGRAPSADTWGVCVVLRKVRESTP
jgi:SAM-dependent methyltransferase